LLKEISTLAAERTLTVLLVTHDPVEATTLCRSAFVLRDGRVEEAGALEDLLRVSRSETLRVFRSHLRGAVFHPYP
jgi:ABC-type thiamine transport system ATPase subunit